MSTKGMSVTAARTLAERICSHYHIPLAIAHDFDATGMTIKRTIGGRDTRRYKFKSKFEVIDLGLRLNDIEDWDLDSEPAAFSRTTDDKRAEQLRKDGAKEDEVIFLLDVLMAPLRFIKGKTGTDRPDCYAEPPRLNLNVVIVSA
jgi:hypothetical protein